jgi:predicted transcriptional regulator
VILPLRYLVSSNQIDAFAGEFKVEITSLPKLMLPNQMQIYYRPKEGTGTFIKLETEVDANGKYLVSQVSDTGEFVIGLERLSSNINPPTLLYPIDKKSQLNGLPVFLNWSPTGRFDYCNLQISTDENFESLELDSTNLVDTRLNLNLAKDKKYYWRVRTSYDGTFSQWSNYREFSLSEPYLKLISPDGGEVYTKDSNYVVRWETNIPDSVKVTLFKDDVDFLNLTDSLYSYYDGYKWLIPTNIPDGNFYKIKIESIKNPSFSAISKINFTIKSFVGISDENYKFGINHYPNPAQNEVTFTYNIAETGFTKIEILDLLGNTLQEVVSEYLTPGNYKLTTNLHKLVPGVYLYKITSGKSSRINKLIIAN